MATEPNKAEASCSSSQPRTWPVSLLGCLQGTSGTNQSPWPWLLFKACFCPASVLGSNETLFQGEEPADVCCLQPYSFCGPTCRGLNAELCGLGNEGLKLCAHTCVLQLACSCMCMGLPYVAWLAALQRQRVMAKHGLAVTDEEAWATACYPCSLLQMHALLQQQYQQQQGLLHSHHAQHQQQAASVPLRAPRVQQMTASEAPSRASSLPGPLTSAMTTSKVMRTVRDHSTRSEGTAGPGGSMRQGLRDSQADDDSSEASETGVVNSPMLDKQHRASDAQEQGSESARSRGDISTRNNSSSRGNISARNNSGSRRTSTRHSSDGAGGSQHKQRPQAPKNGPFLRPPPPAAQPSQPQLGPLMSARSHSSNGGAAYSGQHHMLPPRPGMVRHSRTVSLGGEAAADAAAAAAAGSGRGSDSCVPAPGAELITPEPSSSSIVRSNKRKLTGRAPAASQSCHLPNGFHSSDRLQGAQDSVPSTPPQASSSGLGAGAGAATVAPASAGPAFGANSSTTPGQPGALSASLPGGRMQMHSSCSKASIGGSCSRLVAFSQEDVPLSAFKPNPGGSSSRRASLGASAADLSRSAGGCGNTSSKPGSLASSMQQQQQDFSTPVHCQRPSSGSSSGGGSSGDGRDSSTQHQQHQQLRKVSDPGMEASPAGLAALVLSNPRSSYRMRPDPQYATMQSDICNFASWLGEAPAGLNVSSMQPAQQQQGQEEGDRGDADLHQQEQQHEQQEEQQLRRQETPQPVREQETPQPQRSEGDMCNFGEPMSPADACSPKQAVSPAAQGETTSNAAAADKDAAATTASTAARTAGGQGRITSAPNSSRPAVLAAAWAYMSDMCNLGGSFDAAASAIGRSGLAAAVLSRLAAENSSIAPQASAAATAGQRPSSSDGSSDGGGKQQPGTAAAAAAGSWPDTAPSPPFATLVSGGTFGSEDAAAMAAHSTQANSSAQQQQQQQSGVSKLPAVLPAAAADDESDGEAVSSPPRRRRRGANGGACPSGNSSHSNGSEASTSAAAAGRGVGSDHDSGSSRDRSREGGPQQAQPRAGGVHGLDPEMLAAVTGTTDRDELTASQEELAAKLARLAFANPTAARQLAGAQQQQRGSSAGGQRQPVKPPLPQQQQQQQQQQFEPFYPTMMSDICNLADPDEAEHQQQQQQQLASRENSQGILAGRLSGAGTAAATAAGGPGRQQQQQWQAGDGASMRPPPGRPPVPPQSAAAAAAAAAAARAPPGPYSRQPNLPGRPVRQQDQQQQYTSAATSRLGRPPTSGVMQQPGSNAVAAVAAAATAAGSGDTAGPLRAALLLRGMRAGPGGPKQVNPAAAAAAAAAAAGSGGSGAGSPAAAAVGPMGRRMACPADATGAGGGGSGVGGEAGSPCALGVAPHLAHLQHGQGQYPGQDSFASFDSFYVDCDLPPHAPEPRCAAVEAANMITNNPLYTLTASENGGTADSARFTPALKQQLRDAGAAAAASSAGRAEEADVGQQGQQQGGQVSARGASGTPTAAAAGAVSGGNVAAIVAVFEGRSSSNSDHDDTGAQQLDNSRSNSPAPMFVGDGAVYATAGTAVGGEKGLGKGAGKGYAGRGDAGGMLDKSAGSLHASGGSLRARQLQYDDYDAADRN